MPRLTLSPLLRLTFAITSICGLMVLLADLLLGAFPGRDLQVMEFRRQVAESLATQAAGLLRAEQDQVLRQTLEDTVARLPGGRSALLRRADGRVLVQAGEPAPPSAATAPDKSSLEYIMVPMVSEGQRWGRLEVGFRPPQSSAVIRWLAEPLVSTMLLVSLVGTGVIGLYLRRALQHLDPMAVIPERVQGAFDVMSEGVAVLDAKGRVLLTNKGFRELHPDAAAVGAGQPLSALPWLAKGLPTDPTMHPWATTLKSGQPVTGFALTVPDGASGSRQLLVNTMPISDGSKRVQGCLTSFNDLSELHRSNAALQAAMDELSASRDQVQRQNEELLRIATRDPLTGCLNRRAFNDGFQRLFDVASLKHLALSCLVLDIDHFKRVNDTHGHGIGDRVIQEVARKLSDSARGSDLVCRYGGEEFVLALPGMDTQAASVVAERVRQRIQAECGPAVREVHNLHVTVSIGVASLTYGHGRPSHIIDAADKALYVAKRTGRNRVSLADVDAVAEATTAPG
jgi:diguanylate cyclase (GGDEF)-like protein